MYSWHYISMHTSLNIFRFCQKLSWGGGRGVLSMNTFFNTSLCYPPIFGRFSVESLVLLGTGIFTWRKVRLNKVLYMKMLRKGCLKTNFCPGKSLKSPWFCSTKVYEPWYDLIWPRPWRPHINRLYPGMMFVRSTTKILQLKTWCHVQIVFLIGLKS
jgi:hypothetical protein